MNLSSFSAIILLIYLFKFVFLNLSWDRIIREINQIKYDNVDSEMKYKFKFTFPAKQVTLGLHLIQKRNRIKSTRWI